MKKYLFDGWFWPKQATCITWTERLFCGWYLLWWVMLNICLQKYKHKHKYMKSLNKDLMQWTAWWSGCSFSIWEWGFSSIQKKICGSLWGGVPWKCEKSRIWGNFECGLCDRIDGSLEVCPGTVLALGLGKEWSGGRGRHKTSDILGRQVSQRQAVSAGASVRAADQCDPGGRWVLRETSVTQNREVVLSSCDSHGWKERSKDRVWRTRAHKRKWVGRFKIKIHQFYLDGNSNLK